NGGTTAFSSVSAAVELVVTDINDAPVLIASEPLSLPAILEDLGAPQNGVTLGAAPGVTLVSALIGSSITDVDNADPGIAIISGPTRGNLWYSTDAGNTWSMASGLSESAALLLGPTDLVYYRSVENDTGEYDVLTFKAWDTSIGSAGQQVDASTAGGASAFSTETQSTHVSVIPVNDVPGLAVSPINVDFT